MSGFKTDFGVTSGRPETFASQERHYAQGVRPNVVFYELAPEMGFLPLSLKLGNIQSVSRKMNVA
jgi:hypothetical protein